MIAQCELINNRRVPFGLVVIILPPSGRHFEYDTRVHFPSGCCFIKLENQIVPSTDGIFDPLLCIGMGTQEYPGTPSEMGVCVSFK